MWRRYDGPWSEGHEIYYPTWEKPVQRWSATILIETDDEAAAIDAARSLAVAAEAALGGRGRVTTSTLMPERDIP